MVLSVHDIVNQWANPPSNAWQERARRTREGIHQVICAGLKQEGECWEICLVGSSLNGTWTTCSSDIDLHAVLTDRFAKKLPDDPVRRERILRTQLVDCEEVDCEFVEQRRRVEKILETRYPEAFSRQPHSIGIMGEGDRVEADVVFALPLRNYRGVCAQCGADVCHHGRELRSSQDPERRVICYPQLRLEEITRIDAAAGGRFRGVVRIVKCARRAMRRAGDPKLERACEDVPSCMIESVLGRVCPKEYLSTTACYWPTIDRVLPQVIEMLKDPNCCNNLQDLGGVESLFCSDRGWSRVRALAFFQALWPLLNSRSLPVS